MMGVAGMSNDQQQEELEQMLIAALDKTPAERTEDDLAVIRFATGLTNYGEQRDPQH